jgi:segregation and condensation protein A
MKPQMVSGEPRISIDLFEGPLDLLLHLIQIQHIDIAAIPIAKITAQYLETLELMKEMDLDIAGEYLVMAATLILIKSRILLPPAALESPELDEQADPREELIARLKQYYVFREAGRHLHDLNELRRSYFERGVTEADQQIHREWIIDATVVDLLQALKDVLSRLGNEAVHLIEPSPISIREKMTEIIGLLTRHGPTLLKSLFEQCSTKQEAIVIFLAMLELIRIRAIQARQRQLFGDILLALIPIEIQESRSDG